LAAFFTSVLAGFFVAAFDDDFDDDFDEFAP
jgi:hypothetical protein